MIKQAALLLVSFSSLSAFAAPGDLKVILPGKTHVLSRPEIEKKMPLASMTVADPVYKKEKTYEGFWLSDLLKSAGIDETSGDEIVFHCQDGYAPTVAFSKVGAQKGLVAFREKGLKGDWQKFRHGKSETTPAPYYVVWNTSDSAYPWPYQVVAIEVIDFKKKYDRLYPAGEAPDAKTAKGFQLFRNQCLKCHSINLQGGVLGPELNVPKNILEYRDEKVLAEFIRDAKSFRARTPMPSFPDLNDAAIQELLAYFRWAKDHKRTD
jgi:mono/diheme cytochrome c family protein